MLSCNEDADFSEDIICANVFALGFLFKFEMKLKHAVFKLVVVTEEYTLIPYMITFFF